MFAAQSYGRISYCLNPLRFFPSVFSPEPKSSQPQTVANLAQNTLVQ